MNIIFLDIDGVLNSMPYCKSVQLKKGYKEISDFHLKKLSEIYHSCDAKIVLASTWKDLDDKSNKSAYEMYQYLIQSLAKYNMSIYDKTPDFDGNRPLEIATWLQTNKDQACNNFVILDDDWMSEEYAVYELADKLIQTRFFCNDISEGGLQQEHVKKAIEILNTKKN